MNITIVGGGTVSFNLTKTLMENGNDVNIIEEDYERCQFLADTLDTVVVQGDGTKLSALERCDMDNCDVFIALTGSDEEFAQNLLRKDGTVGQVTVFKVGDEVRLDDPLFNGCAGKITRIDFRKQRARVDYHFAGMDCFTWIAIEMIGRQESRQEG